MDVSDSRDGLRFACECVSARSGYSDPWAGIAQKKLLPDGTKEQIMNLLAQEPKTIAHVAKGLSLSQPSIHTHINEMMASELLRESSEWEKKYPTERYYEPNFPVVKAGERVEFETLCREMAERVADLFEQRRDQLERAFGKTGLSERGWTFSDLCPIICTPAANAGRASYSKSAGCSRSAQSTATAWSGFSGRRRRRRIQPNNEFGIKGRPN